MDNTDEVVVRENIKKLRGLRGLTQKQLAEKVGVMSHYISRWERGIKPTVTNLTKLAFALNVDVSELTTETSIQDTRDTIDHSTTFDLDSTEARLKFLIKETVEAILARDPRLRLMDEYLEEIVRYIRSQGDIMSEIKKKSDQMNSLLEQAIKSQMKRKKV